jgi:hypothetical protein
VWLSSLLFCIFIRSNTIPFLNNYVFYTFNWGCFFDEKEKKCYQKKEYCSDYDYTEQLICNNEFNPAGVISPLYFGKKLKIYYFF